MIVSKKKGTTTDQSEKSIEILGQKVNLIDSAGLRDSNVAIEKLGIEKTFNTLKQTKKIIIVLSPDSLEINSVNKLREAIDQISFKNIVIVFNKSDLEGSKEKFSAWLNKIPKLKKFKFMTISCKKDFYNNKILKKLYRFLHKHLISVDTNSDDYYFSGIRQLECLNKIEENLKMAIDHINTDELSSKFLRDAMSELDSLYGKHSQEEELGIIFSKFCIGK
jgi:tRNA modification GTPase